MRSWSQCDVVGVDVDGEASKVRQGEQVESLFVERAFFPAELDWIGFGLRKPASTRARF
jgi:hypothetical protein